MYTFICCNTRLQSYTEIRYNNINWCSSLLCHSVCPIVNCATVSLMHSSSSRSWCVLWLFPYLPCTYTAAFLPHTVSCRSWPHGYALPHSSHGWAPGQCVHTLSYIVSYLAVTLSSDALVPMSLLHSLQPICTVLESGPNLIAHPLMFFPWLDLRSVRTH